jgi:hypothetical protein
LLLAVKGEAVFEKLGTLFTPVAAPVAVIVRGEAVEGGKDIEVVVLVFGAKVGSQRGLGSRNG